MTRSLSSACALVILVIVTPAMGGDRLLDDERRLPKQQAEARLWSVSVDPTLTMSITAEAEPCDTFLGEVRMAGGNSGEVRATVCFGPDKPTGDVELVSGLGDSLSMHYLSFTFEPSTRKAGYSLKRVFGGGSFANQAFVSSVATLR
jgi:hypothetical protein